MKFLLHSMLGESCSCWWNSSEAYPSSPACFQSSSTFSYRVWWSRASQLLWVFSGFFHILYNAGDRRDVGKQPARQGSERCTSEGWLTDIFPLASSEPGTAQCLPILGARHPRDSQLWVSPAFGLCSRSHAAELLCAGTRDLSFK